MLRVAVTRSGEQLADLAARARGGELKSYRSRSSTFCRFRLSGRPIAKQAISIGCCFTSGPRRLAVLPRMKSLQLNLARRTRFGAVGDKTAEVLKKFDITDRSSVGCLWKAILRGVCRTSGFRRSDRGITSGRPRSIMIRRSFCRTWHQICAIDRL